MSLRKITPIALTTTFGLQLLRMLLPMFQQYLRDSVGWSSLALAPLALGLFALAGLAGPLKRALGVRLALLLTAGGVALLRLAEQISPLPAADLFISAAGTVLFLWFWLIALGAARTRFASETVYFGLGLLLGTALDSTLKLLGGTLDLSWYTSPALPIFSAFSLVLLLVILQLSSLKGYVSQYKTTYDLPWKNAWSLLALGPWLFLQLQALQNPAAIAAITGWQLPLAGLFLTAANALGILWACYVVQHNRLYPLSVLPISVALVVGIILAWGIPTQPGISPATYPVATYPVAPYPVALLAGLGFLLALLASPTLLLVMFEGIGHQQSGLSGLMRSSLVFTLSSLLLAGFSFAYYASYDLALGFRSPVLLPAAALVAGLAALLALRSRIAYSLPQYRLDYLPAIAAGLMMVIPLTLHLNDIAPQPSSPLAQHASGMSTQSASSEPGRQLRIMTYNLHQGFDTTGRLDLEAMAQVIEAQQPDVVALQEVSRGWITAGSVDMLAWLSKRLHLPYVYGPTADPLWGIALLSRLPLQNPPAQRVQPLPPADLLLRRGYIQAEIQLADTRITLLATHFYHVQNENSSLDNAVRLQQVQTLLAAAANAPYSIILGDLNAPSDAPELQPLLEKGYQNAADLLLDPGLRYTYPSTNPQVQLDYIWASSGLRITHSSIPQSKASDHLPSVATITVP